jgi:hypothetical protein
MSSKFHIESISSGYRPIRDGRQFNQFFGVPDEKDRVIIEDGEVDDTVELMKKVVWKYLSDTKKISEYLKGRTLRETCENIWNFLYNHIQYKLDKRGLEQLRRPARSWAERSTGIDCDCFSIFVSSILTNLQIPHKFRIARYDLDVFQHVYVIVPDESGKDYYIIDCVLSQFNFEKQFTEKKDFTMSLNGINVAVLSGTVPNVMELVNDLEGIENLGADSEQERLQAIYAHLVKTRNLVAGRPHLVQDVDYPPAFLKMLDYAIANWNTPNREKALAILEQNEDAFNKQFQIDGISENSDLDGLEKDWNEFDGMSNAEIAEELNGKKRKEKKQQKKDAKSQTNAGKPAKKGFFKKVGEAVKKGGKAFVRYNPVTISARNGFLLAMKLNIKKMGSRLKWGYATKEEAAAKNISTDVWTKSKNSLTKVEKLFVDKLQGKSDKLKSAILKGKAGGLSGFDDEFILTGLGVAPAAAALIAAVPVITAALKIMVDSGVMTQTEADGLQADIDAKSAEGDIMMNDPELKDDDAANDDSNDDKSDDSGDDSDEDGIIGFVKKNPVIAVGGAGLALWGISKLFAAKKDKPETAQSKELSGTPKKRKKAKRKSKVKSKSGKAKIEHINMS